MIKKLKSNLIMTNNGSNLATNFKSIISTYSKDGVSLVRIKLISTTITTSNDALIFLSTIEKILIVFFFLLVIVTINI